MLIHVFRHARLVQPVAILLENVDMFSSHEHHRLAMKFAGWAGFTLCWAQVHDMKDIGPLNRKRWLACLIRSDLCDTSRTPTRIHVLTSQDDKWIDPKFAFDVPPELSTQRAITPELRESYGVRELLPSSKRSLVPVDATQEQVMTCRLSKTWEPLATLVANYSSQHCLPTSYVQKAGLYAELVTDSIHGFAFQCPIMWATLHGCTRTLHMPKEIELIFRQLGNAITVPHAAMPMCVALDLLQFPLPDTVPNIVLQVWEAKLNAFNSVCIQESSGFVLMPWEAFVDHLWIPNPIQTAAEQCIMVVLTLPNRHTVQIPFQRGNSVENLFKAMNIPAHVRHKFAIRDDSLQGTMGLYTPIIQNTVGEIVFLPAIGPTDLQHPLMHGPFWIQKRNLRNVMNQPSWNPPMAMAMSVKFLRGFPTVGHLTMTW